MKELLKRLDELEHRSIGDFMKLDRKVLMNVHHKNQIKLGTNECGRAEKLRTNCSSGRSMCSRDFYLR
jgi:hypothetical protein